MNYEEIYNSILSLTNGFTNNKGNIHFDTLYEAKLAYSILKPNYEDISISEKGTGFDVDFTNGNFEEEYKDFDFQPDKGAGIAKFNASMGESWEDEDEPTLCPECGRDMHRVEGTGNDWLYKCNDCGDYYLLDKDNKLTLAEDTSFKAEITPSLLSSNLRFKMLPKQKQDIVIKANKNFSNCDWETDDEELLLYQTIYKDLIDEYNKKRYGFTW